MSDTRPQARLRPVIRVFVSSTFSDMKHERNALETDAFPKLEQLCQRHGFQFQAIDLRWGVSTEAGLDHRTMRICFDELRRAQELSPRPNFLILLGNRYGWRPLPEKISVEEFHALEQAAAQIPGSADKSAVAVLQEWYREDTNAVPPVYLLQSRLPHLPDWKGCKEDATWNHVQAVLWAIINRAMPPEQLQRRFDGAASEGSPPAIVRFQASATEQEVWHGALRVPDAGDHVLAFFREIENLADFSEPKKIKQIKDFVDLDPSGSVEIALQTEEARLKAELLTRLGSANVFCNQAPVRLVEVRDNQGGRTADVTTGHLAQLCADVVRRMSEIIQGQIDEYWRNTAQASTDRAARELEIEQREYEQFAKERGGEESFVGRQAELQAILDYVGSDSRWPLVIHGASGCGKTALLARASQEVAKIRKRIERFIGVAPRSSDLRSLLSSLCQELRQRNPRPDPLPTEIKELRDEFFLHLQAATPDQPLILFLDALDQLSDADGGRLLNWLPPDSLPAHVKLVVSCLSDQVDGDPAGQPYAELRRRQIPVENFINPDVLSEAEARLLLFDRWLPMAGRKVSEGQRARIEQRLASPACRQPIFLKLLFEEVQLWHSYDPAPVPGESVYALLGQLFDRLSQPMNHGPLLVNRVLGYLSASRYGLAENEILEIVFADPEYRAKLNEATEQTRHQLPPNAKRIPITLWSRLRFDLAPYLTERAAPGANVLTFYHRQVAEWVQERFAKSPDQIWQPHRRLVDYFDREADPQSDRTWLGGEKRSFEELPYHLVGAGHLRELRTILSDLAYLDARVLLSGPMSLLSDYMMVPADGTASVEAWRAFLLLHASSLSMVPSVLPSLAWYAGSPEVRQSAEAYLLLGRHRHSWLKLDPLPPVLPPIQESVPHNLETPSFEIVASCDEIRTTVAVVVPECNVGFYLKQLGNIGVIDFEKAVVSDCDIPYPPMGRPLTMSASDDGRWVSLVDDAGRGICLELNWLQGERCHPVVTSHKRFTCLLPEIENPVICFACGHLWWQESSGHLVFWKPGLPNITQCTQLRGELRGLCVVSDRIIVLDVSKEESSIVVVDSSGRLLRQCALRLRMERLCVYSQRGVVLLAFDGSTHLLPTLSDDLANGPMILDAVINMFPLMEGVYFETPTQCHFWPGNATAGADPYQSFKLGSGCILAFAEIDDVLYVIKKASAFRAARRGGSVRNVIPDVHIRALCPHSPGTGYSALVESDGRLYASGPEPQQVHRHGRAVDASARNAVANKGQLVWPETPNHIALWTPPNPPVSIKINGIGAVLFVAAGKQGEYWLVNDQNDIWTVNAQGQGGKLASLERVTRPSPHGLVIGDQWLAWCGASMGDDKRQSPDHLDTVIFFQVKGDIGNRSLVRAGHHFFDPDHGKWTLTLWDEAAAEFVCFFQLLGERRFFARVGSPAAIMRGQARRVDITLPEILVLDLEAGTTFANGQGWLVRARTGWLTALEFGTLHMLGAYPASVTSVIASQAGPNVACLAGLANGEVARFSLTRKDS